MCEVLFFGVVELEGGGFADVEDAHRVVLFGMWVVRTVSKGGLKGADERMVVGWWRDLQDKGGMKDVSQSQP